MFELEALDDTRARRRSACISFRPAFKKKKISTASMCFYNTIHRLSGKRKCSGLGKGGWSRSRELFRRSRSSLASPPSTRSCRQRAHTNGPPCPPPEVIHAEWCAFHPKPTTRETQHSRGCHASTCKD